VHDQHFDATKKRVLTVVDAPGCRRRSMFDKAIEDATLS